MLDTRVVLILAATFMASILWLAVDVRMTGGFQESHLQAAAIAADGR